MPLYHCQPPTGYADRADAWVNTGALLNRMNFAVALTRGDVNGVVATVGRAGPPATIDRARDGVIARDVLAGDIADADTAHGRAAPTIRHRQSRLLLGSPEFQRR